MPRFIEIFILVVSSLFAQLAQLPAQNRYHSDSSEQFDRVSFPTSCSPQIQETFGRGVALLHSFEYQQAVERFRKVQKQDPSCAIAYWGEAMCLYHQLWSPPSENDLAEGWHLVQKARSAVKKSPREEEYIDAVSVLFMPGMLERADRTAAYLRAMERIHQTYPSDEEAAAFYALSLLATESPADTSLRNVKKAVEVLNRVLAEHPDHPGALHYMIHACDNPGMAKAGLAAARRYAAMAPSSPHALHMPSHIFARLGMWQEAIASNLASLAAAERTVSGTESRLHAMEFLEYAFLQTAQDAKAQTIEEEAVKVNNEGFSRGMEPYYFYVQAHFPALLLLETKNWKQAGSLQPPQNAGPGFEAITYWAQAIGAGHLGNVTAGRAAVHKLDLALAASTESHPDSLVPPVDTYKNEAHAWLAFIENETAAAFELLQPVIHYQEHVGKGETEPPAREMYADMLLELRRPEEAFEQYRLSLKSDPKRFNGLYGAGRSAELAHQMRVATSYYKQLLDNCSQGQRSKRAELERARRVIAETAKSGEGGF